jgi:hypothetical protein
MGVFVNIKTLKNHGKNNRLIKIEKNGKFLHREYVLNAVFLGRGK